MRILFLTNNDAGLYKFRRELIEKTAEQHEVFFCLPQGEYVPKLTALGGKYIPCELECRKKNPIQELQLIIRYYKILRKYKPDIVFTYTIKPNIYGGMMCAMKRIPYIANITGLGSAVENEGALQKVVLRLYQYGLRKAQRVFFQNAENRDFMLSRKIVRRPYTLLPGSGVNLEQYKVLDYPDTEVINFVYAARIMKEKGIDQYLDAAEYIAGKYPDTRFYVCGALWEEEYRERMAALQSRGIISYCGMVEDMSEIYRKSHCIILPTYYPEGLSNTLLESCASARPIITTDRSGCRETIDDGVNGFIVKPKDSRALIRVIENFLNLSREEQRQMGLAGRAKVEKEFDRRIVIKRYMNEIEREKSGS